MPSIEELTRGLDDQLPEPYPGLTYGARQRHCHRAAQVVAGHRQREAAPPAERSGVSAIAGSGKPTGAATIRQRRRTMGCSDLAAKPFQRR